MIPEIELEQRTFEDMVQEYRQTISNLYPEWTNFNPHDPGMTLMELFIWMKSVHTFELDQITDEHRKKYLKLLGEKLRMGKPASCMIQVFPKEDESLMIGTKFFAEHICFENDKVGNLYRKDIEVCLCFDGKEYTIIDNDQLEHEGRVLFYPFGAPVKEGNACFMKLDVPLKKNGINHLTYLAAGKYQNYRTPVKPGDEFIPLCEFDLEVLTEDGWKICEVKEDTTYGLIQDGCISFENSYDMMKTMIEGQNGYFLRMILKRSEFESSPGCAGIGLDWVSVSQKETFAVWERHKITEREEQWIFESEHMLSKNGFSEILWIKDDESLIPAVNFSIDNTDSDKVCYVLTEKPADVKDEVLVLLFEPEFDNLRFLENATGFPDQSFDLHTDRIFAEDFDICVEDDEYPGTFHMWQQVDDFDNSGPEDTHYELDTDNGILKFGDGFHGMMPEGRIVIAGYSLYMGERGNIKSGRFKNQEHARIISHFDAYGGSSNESIEDVFLRVKEELEKTDRAVTAADYEYLVKHVPGLMIEACKIVAGSEMERIEGKGCDDMVGVVVKPYSDFTIPRLTDVYRKNIENYLRPRVLLGTKVKIYAPLAIRISVYGEMSAKAQYYNARQIIENLVRKFFEIRGHQFGTPILYSDLYRELLSLDCIQRIGRLSLEGRGNGAINQANGDIYLPPYGVAVLQEISFQIVTE